jgi:hypothetical protein
MTPGLEVLLAFIACYTLGFLWLVLPEPADDPRFPGK